MLNLTQFAVIEKIKILPKLISYIVLNGYFCCLTNAFIHSNLQLVVIQSVFLWGQWQKLIEYIELYDYITHDLDMSP